MDGQLRLLMTVFGLIHDTYMAYNILTDVHELRSSVSSGTMIVKSLT